MTNTTTEASKPAAAQEAVTIHQFRHHDSSDWYDVTPEDHPHVFNDPDFVVRTVYAAPVAAAPVDGWDAQAYSQMAGELETWKQRALTAEGDFNRLHNAMNAEDGPTHLGEPVLSTPAAPGIDVAALREMLEGWKNSDYPFSYEGQCAQKALNSCIADVDGLLIDASPKGDAPQDDRFPGGFADAIAYADEMEEGAGRLYEQVIGFEDGSHTGTDMLAAVLRELQDSPKGGSDALVRELVDADIAYDAAEQALVAHDKPTLRRDADWYLEQERLDAIADAAIERRAVALAAMQATSAEVGA